MPKYYVKCRDLRFILSESDPKQAAVQSFLKNASKGRIYDPTFKVSELGFDVKNDATLVEFDSNYIFIQGASFRYDV